MQYVRFSVLPGGLSSIYRSLKKMNTELPARVANALNPEYLELILFPTEQCNFRCTYCYEDFEMGRMQPDIIAGVKALIENRMPSLRHLEIGWFGGEPLAAKDIVFDISTHIASLRKNYPELVYTAHMTTNGSLLDKVTFQKLSSLGIRSYQISLDGDEEMHNQSRISANGQGTFNKIWQNLLSIHECRDVEAEILIRIHFLPETYLNTVSLIKKINSELADDSRFSFFFKPIQRLGGASDEKISLFTTKKAEEDAIKFLQSHLKYQETASPLNSMSDYVCYASKANSLAIRSNGDIAKCTVALSDERNKVGSLNKDGTVEIDQNLFRLWLKGLESGNDMELGCPYSAMNTLATFSSK
jgi:uncharacterized protein